MQTADFELQEENFGRGPALWQQPTSGGAPVIFLPANGFPALSYHFLLKRLPEYAFFCMENRALWPQPRPRRFGWEQHAEDLIRFIERRRKNGDLSGPATVVGHSIGATTTAMAATRRPELFRRIIAIDPATTPHRTAAFMLRYVPPLANRFPLVANTLRRKDAWDSAADFVAYLKSKRAYTNFTQEALDDYAAAGLKTLVDGRVGLRYPKEWEAMNFRYAPYVWPVLRKVSTPLLVMRGVRSPLHPPESFQRLLARMPDTVRSMDLEGVGHLAPQENPGQVAEALREALGRQGG